MKINTLLLLIPINTAFAALPLTSNSVARILERYNQMESNVCARLQVSTNGTEYLQEGSVYLAGYIHSKAAAPVLIDNITVLSDGSYKLLYADLQGYNVVDSNGTVLARTVATTSHYPEPPSPALAALTHIPCSFESLLTLIQEEIDQTNRVTLLSWVAAVHNETQFFDWLETQTINAPEQWAWINEYATTNLVGRKPFSVRIYRNSFEEEDCLDAGLYDGFVKNLRDIACRAETAGDSNLCSFAISALNELGMDIDDFDENPRTIEYLSR